MSELAVQNFELQAQLGYYITLTSSVPSLDVIHESSPSVGMTVVGR